VRAREIHTTIFAWLAPQACHWGYHALKSNSDAMNRVLTIQPNPLIEGARA
jgi:hypothetical protein